MQGRERTASGGFCSPRREESSLGDGFRVVSGVSPISRCSSGTVAQSPRPANTSRREFWNRKMKRQMQAKLGKLKLIAT